jgi:hypothetical protein
MTKISYWKTYLSTVSPMTSEEIKLQWQETRCFYKVIIVFIDNNKKNANIIIITFYEVKSGWMPHTNAHMTVERYVFQ